MPKMNALAFSVLALLRTSMAFEMTIYNNVDGCNAKDDTMYRLISKSQPFGDSQCYTFDQDMPGTTCEQFTNGGSQGPDGCSGSLLPQSVFAHEDDGDGGSCAVYSDENCEQDITHVSQNCVDASFLPGKKIGSFKCNGKPVNTDCKVKFHRLSTVDGNSMLGSVTHSVWVKPMNPDDNLPEVPLHQASCWGLFPNWGKGCGWHKTEKTDIDQGWSVDHQGYTPYQDFDADVTMYGNGCDGTVLKCTASHGAIQEPDPEGGKLIIIYTSETHCAPEGEDTTASFDQDDGSAILAGLQTYGNTYGWNGDVSTIQPADAASSYTCDLIPASDTVCEPYWKCVDTPNDVTAYFDGTASFQSTMTTNPEATPMSSPAPCASPTGSTRRIFRA